MAGNFSNKAYWEPLAYSGQALGGFATIVGVIVTALATVLVVVQIFASRRQARDTSALETHREYIRLCIEYPQLGCSRTMLGELGRNDFKGILEKDPTPEDERALWFLSYVLHTMEQLYDSTQRWPFADAHWRATIWSQLDYHRMLLEEVWPSWSRHYGARFGTMVHKLLGSEAGDPEPGT